MDTEPDAEHKNIFEVLEYASVALLLILLKGHFVFLNKVWLLKDKQLLLLKLFNLYGFCSTNM